MPSRSQRGCSHWLQVYRTSSGSDGRSAVFHSAQRGSRRSFSKRVFFLHHHVVAR